MLSAAYLYVRKERHVLSFSLRRFYLIFQNPLMMGLVDFTMFSFKDAINVSSLLLAVDDCASYDKFRINYSSALSRRRSSRFTVRLVSCASTFAMYFLQNARLRRYLFARNSTAIVFRVADTEFSSSQAAHAPLKQEVRVGDLPETWWAPWWWLYARLTVGCALSEEKTKCAQAELDAETGLVFTLPKRNWTPLTM